MRRRPIATTVATLLLAACSSSDPVAPEADIGLPDAAQDLRPQPDAARDTARPVAPGDATKPDAAPPVDATTDSKPVLPTLPVVILAGQSNMVGLGLNNALDPAQAAPVASTTIYYNPSIHPNANGLKWLPLAPGFGVYADRFGPELSFGRRLHELWPAPPLAIIKVAEGGTALHDRWAAKTGDLYQLLVAEVKSQLAVLRSGAQAEIVGLVWMQGESDATQTSHAAAYQSNLTGFVAALKQDLGLAGLPVVAGLIGVRPQWPYAAAVRGGTIAAAAALSPMAVVETTDLSTFAADPIHHDTAGNLALGRRFADALAAIFAPGWSFPQGFGPMQGGNGWSYRHRLGTDVQPMTWEPQHNRWAGSEASLLVGAGWMHPGPTRSAELVWTAPAAGTVQVAFTVAAADNRGGDGTWAEVAAGGQTAWGPTAIPNAASVTHKLTLTLQQGDELQLRTSSGPAQDPFYDATAWTVDITPAP